MNYSKSILYFFIILLGAACQKSLDSLVGKELLEANNNTNLVDTILEVYTLEDKLFPDHDTIAIHPVTELFPLGYYNDQYFGGVSTSIYLQLKPPVYPYVLQTKNPTIDSIVLGLKVVYVWGDTVIKNFIKYEVNEITDANFLLKNISSFFNVLNNQITVNSPNLNINPNPIDIRSRFDSFYSYREAVIGQYRINLDDNFAQKLLNAYVVDTTAFGTDDKWNTLFPGLKITPDKDYGNSLSYISLLDTTTRLSLYYHDPAYPDSPFIAKFYFRLDSSAYALNVTKDRSSIFNDHYSNQNNDQLFLETQPGGYTLLRIPELQNPNFKNIIVNQ
ncbi:MAG: hypothetical protein ACRCR9_03895, partial [Chitinophagaceae bacterium]